jgi:hypothetical protein
MEKFFRAHKQTRPGGVCPRSTIGTTLPERGNGAVSLGSVLCEHGEPPQRAFVLSQATLARCRCKRPQTAHDQAVTHLT